MTNRIYANTIKFTNSIFTNKYRVISVDLRNIPFVNNSMAFTFYGCTNLTDVVNINDSITSMYYSFASCKNLVNISNFPDTVTNLQRTFADCKKLETFNHFPNNAVDMQQTFWKCDNLISVPDTIPSSVTSMFSTFENCFNLVNGPINIPNGVTTLYSAFNACHNLKTTPIIPNSVTNMANTFSGCKNLVTPPVLPNGVKDISGFISYCPQFLNNYPTVPSSVTKFDYAFTGMGVDLTDVPSFCLDILANCAYTTKYWRGTFMSWPQLVNMPNIPNSMTSLESCFRYDRCLTNVTTIPSSVTSMVRTFMDCVNLTTPPTIPNSVTNMAYCFQGCRNLAVTPVIPNSVKGIDLAFADCVNLTTIPVIPSSVEEMTRIFENCVNLTGNVYVYSNKIRYATRIFNNTDIIKNVYIPYTNSDGTVSKTYNTFIAAGYDELGTKEGVHLKNILMTLTINPTPADATVIITADGYTQSGNSITVPYNTPVSYTVSKELYKTVTVTDYAVLQNETINVELERDQPVLNVEDYDYTTDANDDVILTHYKGTEVDVVIPEIIGA